MRAGAGLGVVLNGRAGNIKQRQPLNGSVIEIHVAQLGGTEVGLPADRFVGFDPQSPVGRGDSEAVVLRGDLDLPCAQILNRVVHAAMAERQLEGFKAQGPAAKLMAKANSEDRLLAEHTADGFDNAI